MPSYKNTSASRRFLNNKVIEPGSEMSSPIFYNENEIGLIKTSDMPSHNAVLYAKKIDKPCEIIIPQRDTFNIWVNKYTTHFYVKSGEVIIWTNSKENAPPLILYQDARWNIRSFERNVERFIVDSEGKFTLYVIIEKCQ